MHRLFTHLITRLFVKDLIMRQGQEQVDDLSTIETNFDDVIARYIDKDSSRLMLSGVLKHFAVNMGYVSEIAAGKWVYKGEQFKKFANLYRSKYSEIYLKGIAIY